MKHKSKKYTYYRGIGVKVIRTTYQNNGRTAVVMYPKNHPDMHQIITVNLDDGLEWGPEYAYLDTNNLPGIEECMMESGLAVPTGMYCRSGYCRYPLFKFDLSKIPEMKL